MAMPINLSRARQADVRFDSRGIYDGGSVEKRIDGKLIERFRDPAIELNDHFGATVAQSGERLANAPRSVAETDVPEPPAGVADYDNRLCPSVLTKARLLVTVALDMDCWPGSAGAKVAGGIRTN
jgi:hypothetical protein